MTLGFRKRQLLPATALLLFAACATTPALDGEWVDPQFSARNPLHGARVLVACDAYEAVVQRVCQERLAGELAARGAVPVPAPDLARSAPAMPISDAHWLAAGRQAHVQAVFSATITLAGSDVRPGFSIGLGGFGGGRHVGTGVGVSVPIGGSSVSNTYAANGKLTDVASGRLMWTAKASGGGSRDIDSQIGELARRMVGGAEKAGLF